MSRADNPQAAVATDHNHGLEQEQQIVTDLMQVLGISCRRLGAHSHSGKGLHHHHDFRCLVSAGENQIRPSLTQEQVMHQMTRQRLAAMTTQYRWKQNALDALAESKSRVDAELAQMRQFMLATPAQGPWLTVADQYLDWLSEEQEQ